MVVFHDEQYMIALGALVGYGLNFAYSWRKYIKGRTAAESD